MWTIVLLFVSNVFMTFAWYFHVKHQDSPIWKPMWAAILLSWGIALAEYCFQVPANRLGSAAGFKLAQLKTIQEIITLIVFSGYSVLVAGEPLKWNYIVGFGLIAVAGFFVFNKW